MSFQPMRKSLTGTPMSESLADPMLTSLHLAIIDAKNETENPGLVQQKLRKMVLQAVPSEHSKRNYAKALDEVFTLCANRSQGISRPLLMEYRAPMIEKGLSPSKPRIWRFGREHR